MPKINRNAHEESSNSLEETSLQAIRASIPYPMMICGVNRKVNTGGFENVDLYSGLALPIMAFPAEDLEEFKQAVIEAANVGFALVSKETGKRYEMLKDLQSGGRNR